MKPSRILVCGGRDFNDKNYVFHILDGAVPHFDHTFCVIVGGATGADSHGRDWALARGVACIEMRANWEKFGKQAGSLRNTWMLEWGKPDLVIAFDGGPGTAHMKRIAKIAGVQVYAV